MRTQFVESLTRNEGWSKMLSANSTSAAYPSTAITTTSPVATATSGIINLKHTESTPLVINNLMLAFYGAGSDNNTYTARVWGWQQLVSDGTPTLWIPTILAEITCQLCTFTGTGSASIASTDRLCDTYALANGFNSNVSVEVVSPANNTGGYVMIDVRGFSMVQVDFAMVTATNANCIYRGI
jgi:hypothetical protein